MSRLALVVVSALLMALVGSSLGVAPDANATGSHRTPELELVKQFDPALFEFPKGLAFDRDGNVYVGMGFLAQVRKFAPDGTETTIAQIPVSGPIGTFGLSDLAAVEHGSRDNTIIYATLVDLNGPGYLGPDSGVYRIDRDGNVTRIPGTEVVQGWGMAVDRDETIYVTDTRAGGIWRISPDAAGPELWVQDPLLEGDGSLGMGIPLGAAAITLDGRSLLVTVEEKARVVRVDINKDGSAGGLSVVVEDPSLYIANGITVAPNGTTYVSSWFNSLVSVLDRDGNLEVIADSGDGLLGPETLSFGKGPLGRYLYIVNQSAFMFPDPNPALYRIDVNR